MTFQSAINTLYDLLRLHVWAGELAGILPLSAFIDFVDVPHKLHAIQLAGSVPLWSWVITPSGSRLLLNDPPESASRTCVLDRFGSTAALEVLDGRYGERYFAASPETFRLLLASLPTEEVVNDHVNMDDPDLRSQTLEVIHISRRNPFSEHSSSPMHPRWRRMLHDATHVADSLSLVTVVLGWLLLVGMLVMSAFFKYWISFAFYLLIPTTGLVVFVLHGSRPRRLLVEKPSEYVRLLLISEHMNSAEWTIVYGESSIINSLLNRPLEPVGSSLSAATTAVSRVLLRVCIIGQWALALAAATTKDWNAYFICFWVLFSIFSHSYLITPTRLASAWAKDRANLKAERFRTRLSSRRALLNTVLALNPDTFARDPSGDTIWKQFYEQGLRWLDPILRPSDNRTRWQEATRQAMEECDAEFSATGLDLTKDKYQRKLNNFLSKAWHDRFSQKGDYWKDFISEGIYIANKIRKTGKLPATTV